MLMRLVSHFLFSGNMLYRSTFNTTLLRCVNEKEVERLMKELHEGACGPHMNKYILARKIMRIGYFKMTMESECIKDVRYNHLC